MTPIPVEISGWSVQKSLQVVRRIAAKMASRLPSLVDFEDLVHDGLVGLLEAQRRYDASRGVQFQTYATNRIRGAILDRLRSMDWLSRGARQRQRQLKQGEEALQQKLGRRPQSQELAGHLNWPAQEVDRGRQQGQCPQVSLEAQAEDFLEGVPDAAQLPEELLCTQEKLQALGSYLRLLSQREQLIVSLHYAGGQRLREISQILGVSEARVSQIHSRSLRKIRQAMEQEQKVA